MAAMSNSRGERRKAELIEAGFTLLGESGWGGVTHRGVAVRAEANPGLVHYYFNGTPGLRLAVAAQAVSRSIGTMFDDVLTADDENALFAAIGQALVAARSDRERGRVTTEVVGATFDDAEIGALVRTELARGRARVEGWFASRHPSWSPQRSQGAAAVLVAMVDGLLLHLLLDPGLPTEHITAVLRGIACKIDDEE